MTDIDDLDKRMSEQDWDQFTPGKRLHPAASEKMFQVIENHVGKKAKARHRILYLRRTSIAAAVLLICFGIWKWTGRTSADFKAAEPLAQTVKSVHWTEKMNHTGKKIRISLPDSSTVELDANSRINYLENLAGPERNILLEGGGVFKVAKDQTRPFTVHAAGFATTALGTAFRISTDAQGGTSITLLNGRIVIRPDSLNHIAHISDAYLSPGQQWQFDPKKQLATIVSPADKQPARPVPVDGYAGKILRFDNQTLSDIFHTLEKEYHYNFICKDEEVNTIRFTGVFDNRRETLSGFVATLATLNDLTIVQKHDSFIIK